MAKTLHVIDPFFIAELGDTFELDENGNTYSLQKNEEFYKVADDKNSEVQSSFSSVFSISTEYAARLIKDGYLQEVNTIKNDKEFVNIFDEIDSLINKYTYELDTLYNAENDETPKCVKVEKETVLNNLITMLNHLKALKK